jgi:hypothetical protein
MRYYFFLEAIVFAGGIWLTAWALAAADVPQPSDRVWITALMIFIACFVIRFTYCLIRKAMNPASWMGFPDAELRAWRYGAIALLVGVVFMEPSGDFFWPLAVMLFQYSTMPATSLTRLGAARHRAAYELNQQRLREKFPVQIFPPDWK